MSEKRRMEADVLVGGQAVLEGVMMRTPNAYAVAVRRPDGTVAIRREPARRWTDRYPPLKLPFVRGTAILVQSLALGIRALNFSAEAAMEAAATEEKKPRSKRGERWAVAGTMLFSFGLAIALFVYFPYWLGGVVTRASYPAPGADPVHEHWIFFNVVDGAIRLVVFLAYLMMISLMSDIRRVFQYHGAEHKVVHLWESKRPLTLENARPFTTLHPRCGTSFLLFVMVVGIAVFTVFKFDWWVLKVLSRVFLLPLIAGISYELVRLSARFPKNPAIRLVMSPGLCLQRITTRPPTDDMLEVSLRALDESLALEKEIAAETRERPSGAA